MASARYSVLEMPRVRDVRLNEGRLEEARVEVAHHLGGADRREIGGALVPPLSAECVAESEQHDRPGEQHTDDREHHQRRLAPRVAEQLVAADRSAGRHRPAPWPERRYDSTPAC